MTITLAEQSINTDRNGLPCHLRIRKMIPVTFENTDIGPALHQAVSCVDNHRVLSKKGTSRVAMNA